MKKYYSLKSVKFYIFVFLSLLLILLGFFAGKPLNGLILAICTLIIGGLDFSEIKLNMKSKIIISSAVLLISSVVVAYLTQFLQNETLKQLPAINIAAEILIVLVVLVAVKLFVRSDKVSITATSLLLLLLATANYYVYNFRGNEMTPADILSVKIASEVADNYTFVIYPTLLYGYGLFFMYLAFIWCLPDTKLKTFSLKAFTAQLTVLCVLVISMLKCTDNITSNHFDKNGTLAIGFVVNAFALIRESIIIKPAGYTEDIAGVIYEQYDCSPDVYEPKQYPDIIVIMDESFADFNNIGDLPTNIPVTPYINALNQYAYKGYALSSVFGGGTPNSEYEFLTGNSLMFLPQGAIPYQQFIDSPTYTILNTLHELNYKCIAMHPFHSKGWMRDKIYPLLGFDEMLFLSDFNTEEKLMREFVSDQSMFETLLDKYHQEVSEGNSVFVFGVTMQNHGSYDFEDDNNEDDIYEKTVEVEFDSGNDYPDAEQYLSLIHESDKAIKYLLDEFSNEEREVIVLFYGDHFPKLDEAFYKELHGSDFKTLDDQQLKYTVPFFVWTNFETDSEFVSLTSINYLSDYIFKTAGIPLPTYNKFISEVSKTSSAMNANGFYDNSKGCFRYFDEDALNEYEILRDYNYLVYNSIKGKNKDVFFPVGNIEK